MTYVIAIAGGSASGKSYISQQLINHFNKTTIINIIRQDDYYKDQTHKTMEERVKTNYDHPTAFDNDLFIQQVKDLKNGKNINKPIYDYTVHNRSENSEMITPSDILILEGLFVLSEEKIRDLCHLLIYVEADNDIRFIRRLKRDTEERGRSVESVCNQYLQTVKPMHDLFIEPSKQFAHMIIPSGNNNEIVIDLLVNKIKSIIQD